MNRSIRAAVLAATSLLGATRVAAQTRAWDVCFTGGVQSCASLTLNAAPRYDASHTTVIGTDFHVTALHDQGSALTSVLYGFSFNYWTLNGGPVGTVDATDGTTLLPVEPIPTTSGPGNSTYLYPGYAGWGAAASSSTVLPYDNDARFQAQSFDFDPNTGYTVTQGLGGCSLAGADSRIDRYFSTYYASCGGRPFQFDFSSKAFFDASLVRAVSIETYSVVPDGLGTDRGRLEGVSSWCTVFLDDLSSVGEDATATGGTPSVNVCTVKELGVPSTTTPEPTSLALLAGVLPVGAWLAALRRRRAA